MADSIPFAMQEDKDSHPPTNSPASRRPSVDTQQLSNAEKAGLFDLLTEQADILVLILDAQGLVRYYNHPALDFWGDKLSRIQAQRNPFVEILPPAQQVLVADLIDQLRHRNRHEIELGMKSVDGKMHWLRIRARKIPDQDGTILTLEDTTDYREAIASLHAREKLIDSVFQAVPVGIGLLDGSGNLVDLNPRFGEIFGYRYDDLKGKVFFDLFPDVQKELMLDLHTSFMDLGSDIPAEWEALTSKGETIHIDLHSTLLEERDGMRFRVVAVKDITRVYLLDQAKKRYDQQKLLLKEISEIFSATNSLDDALDSTLKNMVRFGEFDMAEFWTLDYDEHTLRLKAYHNNSSVHPHFYEDPTQTRQVQIGEGMPGIAWEKGVTLTWDQVTTHPNYLRKSAAMAAGIQSMMALPLFHAGQFMGVLMFGSRSSIECLERYQLLFEELQPLLAAEIRRKQSEDLFSRFFNDSPEMLCLIDLDANFKMLNAAFTKVLGWTQSELKATPALNLVHPDDQEAMLAGFRRVLNGEESISIECRYRTRQGPYKWILWSASQLRGETGTIFGYGKDITEKMHLQQLLDKANELARIGSWELNLKDKTIYWSTITREIHEIPEDFVPRMDNAIQFYKEGWSRDSIREAIEESISKGKSWDLELILITGSGKERWVRAIGQPEMENGRCIGIYGSFQDIHARKEVEMRLQTVANNIPGVLFQYYLLSDGTDRMENLTQGAQAIWGRPPVELMENIQIVWDQLKAGGDYEKIVASIMESAEKMERWHCQYRNLRPDGVLTWLEGFGSPSRMSDGTIRWDAIVMDITEKKKLEELLQSATEMARIGSWELDLSQPEQNEMYWSPMTREILGVPDDYIPSFTGGLEFYVPESRERIGAATQKLIDEGVAFDEELLLTTTDGHPRWIRCIGKGEFYQGRCMRVYGSLQDIHAAKTLELRISTILESIGDAFIAIDTEWRITYWNRMAETILDHNREKVLGREFWHFFKDSKIAHIQQRCKQVMNGGEKQSIEAYFPSLEKWLEINLYPAETGLSLFIIDISQRRRAEREIRESNERFQLVAQATNDAIWDWDFPNETLLWGEGYTHLFGHPLHPDNMTIEFWSKRIHPEDKERVIQSLEAAIENPDISRWREEYRYLKSDGTYAFVVDRGGLMRDASGRAVRMVGSVSDLTYRKQYEESLRELNEALDKRARELALSNAELEQFAYVASHDLQEPLRMVTGFISRLDSQYGEGLDERARQYMRFAVDGAKRMRQLILDLLAFSRAGRQSEARASFSVKEIIHGVCELQKSLIADKNAEVVVDNMPLVYSYKTAFRQIFQNLISNALKYAKPDQPPRVEITCAEQESEWIFAIKDNGIGIHPEYFEKVFVIFQRLHQQDNFGGTGIGLAIVKKQVENLGGRIWVESEEGRGTCFYFSLPREN